MTTRHAATLACVAALTLLVASTAVRSASTGPATRPSTRPAGGDAPPATAASAAAVRVRQVPRGVVPKLAVVTNNASEYWRLFAAGVRRYERRAGVRVDVRMPPNGRREEQDAILAALADDGYDGVGVTPVSPQDQSRGLRATADKLNLVCFDADAPPESGRLAFVGADNVAAGRLAGGRIVKLLPAGGKIALFAGSFQTANAADRVRGIEQVLAGTDVKIAVRREDRTDRARAETEAADVLVAWPEVVLLCGLWSYNGPALARAVTEAGKRGAVRVVAFDDEDATLDAIAAGTIDATLVQDPAGVGERTAALLHRLSVDGAAALPAGGVVDVPTRVIDKAGLKAFREESRRLRE
jgi:ribose transport system substrate-binding protein